MAVTVIYNIEEVQAILGPKGISKTSIYRLIRLGKIKSVKVGKRLIISENALNEFLEGSFSEN